MVIFTISDSKNYYGGFIMFKTIFTILKVIFQNGDVLVDLFKAIKLELNSTTEEVLDLETELLNGGK